MFYELIVEKVENKRKRNFFFIFDIFLAFDGESLVCREAVEASVPLVDSPVFKEPILNHLETQTETKSGKS